MLTSSDIEKRIINNNALFNNILVIHQNFDIIPSDTKHYGASIDFQDLCELRDDFLDELYDSIVDWVYSSEKYEKLKYAALSKGKSERAANSEIQRKAYQFKRHSPVLDSSTAKFLGMIYYSMIDSFANKS